MELLLSKLVNNAAPAVTSLRIERKTWQHNTYFCNPADLQGKHFNLSFFYIIYLINAFWNVEENHSNIIYYTYAYILHAWDDRNTNNIYNIIINTVIFESYKHLNT